MSRQVQVWAVPRHLQGLGVKRQVMSGEDNDPMRAQPQVQVWAWPRHLRGLGVKRQPSIEPKVLAHTCNRSRVK